MVTCVTGSGSFLLMGHVRSPNASIQMLLLTLFFAGKVGLNILLDISAFFFFLSLVLSEDQNYKWTSPKLTIHMRKITAVRDIPARLKGMKKLAYTNTNKGKVAFQLLIQKLDWWIIKAVFFIYSKGLTAEPKHPIESVNNTKIYLATNEISGALAGKWKPPQAKEGHRGMAPRGGLWQSQLWHAWGWDKVLCMNRPSPAGGTQAFLLELKPEPQTAPPAG